MGVWNPDLIHTAFSEAALNPAAWAHTLEVIAAQTESRGAILIPISSGAVPNFPISESMSAATEHYMRDGWYLRDERHLGIHQMMRDGIVDDLDIAPLDTIEKNPYYQEFLAAHKLRWFAGVRIAAGDDLWCLSIQRTIGQGPFSRKEKEFLRLLSDRLSTSAVLARCIGGAGSAGALEAFEMSGKAALLINRKGEVFRINQPAEKLLGGDVRLVRKKLTSYDPNITVLLNRSLHDLMFYCSGGSLGSPIALPRRGRRPVLAYLARLSPAAANPLADCQAIIVLIDLEKPRSNVPAEVLRSAFDLSPAEARLAELMSAGISLEAASDQIGIAKETGRNQLKSIFAKMNVSRQPEMIALLGAMLDNKSS